MFLGQPISLQPTVPGTSSSHQKLLRDVLSNYQRETGQVWTRVGITPTTSSTQQCEEAIRGASLDDLRSVCLAAITTFNTLTQQLTALPNSVLEASIPTSTTKPLLGDLSHTTMAPDTVFSESNNNNNAALAVPLVSQMMKKENEGIDMLAETACPYVLPTRRKLSVSLNSFGVNWGGGGGDATTSPLRPKVPPTKTSPLRPTFVTADGLESSDNASGRKGPGSSKGSIFDGRKNLPGRVYSQVRDRDASVASYTGRAPLQFTNNVATTDNDDGFTMINDYVILDELGSGSFGKVMLAFDTRDDKFVAIKGITKGPRLKNLDLQAVTDEVLNSLPMAERRRLQTIQSEIAVMKDLRHQNLVALHEVMDDHAQNKLFMVLQYVDDGVLANIGSGKMHSLVTSVTGLVSACRQIATGLEYLHRHRVLHRDLKPENVLVDKHSNVYIADFGVSESLANKHISENMGTILFTSPELLDLRTTTSASAPSLSMASLDVTLPTGVMPGTMVLDSEEDDTTKYAPDMWALGVMIYYLLYMRLPFETVDSIRSCDLEYPEAESTSWWTDTTDRQTGNPFTAEQLAARRAMVPEMEKLLRRLLEKDPALRATANEARLALKAVARYIEDVQETTSIELAELADDNGLTTQVGGGATDSMFISPSEANFNGEGVVKAAKEVELTQQQMKLLKGKVSRIRAVCKMAGNGISSSRQQSISTSVAREIHKSFSFPHHQNNDHSTATTTSTASSSEVPPASSLVQNQLTSFIHSMKSLLSRYDSTGDTRNNTNNNGAIAVKRNSTSSALDIPSLNSIPSQLIGVDSTDREGEDNNGEPVGGAVPYPPPFEASQHPNSCQDEVAKFSERVADFRKRVENGERNNFTM